MAQRKEREIASTELGFKKQLTREEKLEKKKQRLAAIGNGFDLLYILCGDNSYTIRLLVLPYNVVGETLD